ncbi:hypothetical protein B0T22DRAFT_47365 [Podospora appendiculata]|uniref:Secreted protein n=1 Tax=Podospora appendiculata TaxID=314037 RepID=A0AAE1CGP5_9PEZI|nr:hypothetical protein B0T22DRAFT_47365 [Podospora appendiculata]
MGGARGAVLFFFFLGAQRFRWCAALFGFGPGICGSGVRAGPGIGREGQSGSLSAELRKEVPAASWHRGVSDWLGWGCSGWAYSRGLNVGRHGPLHVASVKYCKRVCIFGNGYGRCARGG